MCGIVGYIGYRDASDFLLEGLRRLEYRGYDSAGIAVANDASDVSICKTTGRIERLASALATSPLEGRVGIGHTRWATHGPPTESNAHPHVGGDNVVTICHNGVIENFQELKSRLESEGYVFQSATDTEVIAHLAAECLEKASAKASTKEAKQPFAVLVKAVKATLSQLRGTYGLVLMFRDYPGVIIAARLGSPLVLGVAEDEHFVASDASALAGYTDKIVYLSDHQIAVVTADSLQVTHRDLGEVRHSIESLQISTPDVDLGGYSHYMLKEIFEQPESLKNAMRGRLCEDDATAMFGGLNLTPQQLGGVNRIILTACGTSWHAALVGEYLIEEFARIPVEVEYASELRYRNPPVDPGTLVFAISQSGETADTLGAIREMKRKGHRTLAICNTVGSSIAQEADGGVYLHAGPEIGVASTKAYTSQCMVLGLLALYFGRMRHLSFDAGTRIINAFHALPSKVRAALQTDEECKRIAAKYCNANNFLYLGRQYNFPTALEGALKLKEISYIHAEGYPAAEMKHGPIALVDESTPSVFIVPQGFVYEKVMSNIEEVKARGGPVIAIVDHGDTRVAELADDVISVPSVEEFVQPIVSAVPLQLLSYHIALLRGCDVDKPRNLAKSVTVE
ncbi:MAG: glutamine--fructose-6-phosphate transaminase (isomerizing) [Planctomycetaceae bacterium]|nr:glutamine--fructose-6-phosphate transaminase (isomerizing) [Planctomycetales bacterium]MCB9920720.1 glutamine--fructose-6-phosphate transaminase (isomerizing) [Planctomycetaceae bacterium]